MKTHGHKSGGTSSPTYRSWRCMLNRCENQHVHDFPRYGGRGVSVCERWHSFENFLADMGARPSGTTIDRKENSGNYEPENCRWATREEQGRNKRTNHFVRCRGNRVTVAEAAEMCGHNYNSLHAFLRRNPDYCGDVACLKFVSQMKLDREKADQICAIDLSDRKAAAMFGVSRTLIRMVRKGQAWAT